MNVHFTPSGGKYFSSLFCRHFNSVHKGSVLQKKDCSTALSALSHFYMLSLKASCGSEEAFWAQYLVLSAKCLKESFKKWQLSVLVRSCVPQICKKLILSLVSLLLISLRLKTVLSINEDIASGIIWLRILLSSTLISELECCCLCLFPCWTCFYIMAFNR